VADLENKSDRGGQKRSPRDVARVAARQNGAITLAQLAECGLTYREVRGLLAKGHLHPLHRGIFLVGHTRVSRDAHLIAALLTCGSDAFLSNRTSAALMGLRAMNLNHIEVTVVRGGIRARQAPLSVHRARHPPHRDELRVTRHLRHSSFARVLIELSARESQPELTRLVEEGVRRNLFYLEKIERALERHARRPGIANLEGPLKYYLDRSDRKSGLERDFDRELAERPDISPPDRNVHILAGAVNWEIDCYWPESKVVLELDGRPFHVIQRHTEKDKLKDMKLAALGLIPVRVTDRRFNQDTEGVFDDLRALLKLRRAV